MLLNGNQDGIDSYFLTDSNFETVLSSPYALDTMTQPTSQYEGITIFHIDTNDSDTTDWNYWVGYKVQPWPAAAWSEMYRFEAGDKATGLIYNNNGSNADHWIDETRTLVGAMLGMNNLVCAIGVTLLTWTLF